MCLSTKKIIPHYGTASNNADDENKLFRNWVDAKGEPLAGIRQAEPPHGAQVGTLGNYCRRNYIPFFTFVPHLNWFALDF